MQSADEAINRAELSLISEVPQSRAYAVKLARVKLKIVLQQTETRHRWAFDTRAERILPLHLYRLLVDARRISEHESSKLRW